MRLKCLSSPEVMTVTYAEGEETPNSAISLLGDLQCCDAKQFMDYVARFGTTITE